VIEKGEVEEQIFGDVLECVRLVVEEKEFCRSFRKENMEVFVIE
jgi:hypothetical protein